MKELEIAAQEELMHSYSSSTVIISTYGESARIEKCESFFFSQEAMINMFRKGAEWQAKQSPWISVKERLPEENTGVFFAVVWKDLHKGYFVGVYYGSGYWGSEYRIFLPNSLISKVTHWMPIPSFDEILEANRDVLERIKEKGD